MLQLLQSRRIKKEKASSHMRTRLKIPRLKFNRQNCAEPAAQPAMTPSSVQCCRRCPWTKGPRKSGNLNFVTVAYFRAIHNASAKNHLHAASAEKSATMRSFAAGNRLLAAAAITKEQIFQDCQLMLNLSIRRTQQLRQQQRQQRRQ